MRRCFGVLLIGIFGAWGDEGELLKEFLADPSLKSASVGVCVMSVDEGKMVLDWQSGTALIPASTMKLVTTATALRVLGADFEYETRLEKVGEDLLVRGSGDPTFGDGDLRGVIGEWAKAVVGTGIKRVNGELIADVSRFETRRAADDWPWGDVGNYYGAGPSGWNFFGNKFELVFRPGKEGEVAELARVFPEPPGVEIVNLMRTGAEGSGDRGSVYGGPGARRLELRGTVPEGGEFSIWGALPDPALAGLKVLREELAKFEVEVVGEDRVVGEKVEAGEVIAVAKSKALREMIRETNRRSVNLHADAIFKSLTPEGTTEAAVRRVLGEWEGEGIDLTGWVMHDGSGLSPKSTITPRQLVEVLRLSWKDETGKDFLDSFPRWGELWVKPGSLTRVKTYAGYFKGEDGKEYAFAVMINHLAGSPQEAVRRLLFGLVEQQKNSRGS